jgi:Maltokinase N-terminal cap domain
VAKTHPGATLTPHFRDFLPGWVAKQPWYTGVGTPALVAVGFLRFEDPAGEVGIETHLVSDGTAIYQLPMTYRGAPIAGAASTGLIATSEHSVLGTRWIYDAESDPVWVAELLRLVNTGAISDPSSKRAPGHAEARGRRLALEDITADTGTIELRRVLTSDSPVGDSPVGDSPADDSLADEPGVAGLVTGTWYPRGPDQPATTGCLAVIRDQPNGRKQRR